MTGAPDTISSRQQSWTITVLNLSAPLTRRGADLLQSLSEVLAVLSQALTASHHYEELRRKCDAALAQRGLNRADLPRAAYRELTQGY
jgi:hypothetical protein